MPQRLRVCEGSSRGVLTGGKEHVVELGPGDYLQWDGSIPHDAEVIGLDEGRLLIITLARS